MKAVSWEEGSRASEGATGWTPLEIDGQEAVTIEVG